MPSNLFFILFFYPHSFNYNFLYGWFFFQLHPSVFDLFETRLNGFFHLLCFQSNNTGHKFYVTTLIFYILFHNILRIFSVIVFIQVPPKILSKFRRSLPYTRRSQVIDKIILYFQFHFTTRSNHPGSQSNSSSSSTQHIIFNNIIKFKFTK